MAVKAHQYLRAGTALAWIIWPERMEVGVWHATSSVPDTLGLDAPLNGEEVVPGFTSPIEPLLRKPVFKAP